jgi:hypothetical protein
MVNIEINMVKYSRSKLYRDYYHCIYISNFIISNNEIIEQTPNLVGKEINLPDGCQEGNLPEETNVLPDKDTTMEGNLPEETNVLPDTDTTMWLNLPVVEGNVLPDKVNLFPDESSNLPEDVNVLPDKATKKTDGKEDASISSTETITKYICTNVKDHAFWFLAEKGNASWCKPNAMYGGVRCQGESCGKMFVSKVVNPETEFKPTNKKPIHVCGNEKKKCTFAYCHDCYNKGMEVFFSKDNK